MQLPPKSESSIRTILRKTIFFVTLTFGFVSLIFSRDFSRLGGNLLGYTDGVAHADAPLPPTVYPDGSGYGDSAGDANGCDSSCADSGACGGSGCGAGGDSGSGSGSGCGGDSGCGDGG